MKKTFNVAVVGATGVVGQCMLALLEERNFPVNEVYALASSRSVGKQVEFKGRHLDVLDLAEFDFSQVDIGLFSAGASVSAVYAPKAVELGCVVIDNTSQFRYQDDIPLVVPEVNPEMIAKHNGIIANPNCSTIQMVVALKPIYDAVGIHRINVCTYQAVSGAGNNGISELANQTARLLNGQEIEEKQAFAQRIAFNVLPHIDVFQSNGYTKEEMKMVWETQKILADPTIQINPTAVRVPLFYGHSEAINIETKDKINRLEAIELLSNMAGIEVLDDPDHDIYPTPAIHASGHDAVFVGRIREDISCDHGLNLWVVSDNVRKGAALNSIQIAENMLKLVA